MPAYDNKDEPYSFVLNRRWIDKSSSARKIIPSYDEIVGNDSPAGGSSRKRKLKDILADEGGDVTGITDFEVVHVVLKSTLACGFLVLGITLLDDKLLVAIIQSLVCRCNPKRTGHSLCPEIKQRGDFRSIRFSLFVHTQCVLRDEDVITTYSNSSSEDMMDELPS